jgi:hypothetical protein
LPFEFLPSPAEALAKASLGFETCLPAGRFGVLFPEACHLILYFLFGACDLYLVLYFATVCINAFLSMNNAICTTHKKDITKNCAGVLKP